MENKTRITFVKGINYEPDELRGMVAEHLLSMDQEDMFLTQNGLNKRCIRSVTIEITSKLIEDEES